MFWCENKGRQKLQVEKAEVTKTGEKYEIIRKTTQ